MPVVIGGKRESGFDDPIGLLGDCHRRVERFLGVLEKASADAAGRTMNAEQAAAWENALRYFRESAPRHTADEEESLFPRLRALGTEEARALLAQVERLEADHQEAAPAHETVDRLGRLWLQRGVLTAEETTELSGAIARLVALYREHIELEDCVVFPAAARMLSDGDRRTMGAEMAARRGLAAPA